MTPNVLIACGVVVFVFPGMSCAADWPQLQCDPQRTGFTTETVEPPYRVAWSRGFVPERISKFTQTVVYDGKALVGTMSGNLRAMNAVDGADAWTFACGSPIMHTAACADGKAVVAALDGAVYAVNAADGTLAWKFQADPMYGFSAAPLMAQNTVYIGQRQGAFHALNLADGKRLWTFDAGVPIFNTAAYDAGKVFFCDESLRVRCLDADTGKELWASEQLYGQSAKGYHPAIVTGLVFVRPMMAYPQSEYYATGDGDPAARPDHAFQTMYAGAEADKQFREWWQGKIPELTFPPFPENHPRIRWLNANVDAADLRAGRMPKSLLEAQEAVVEFYRAHPCEQDLFVLDAATGRQAFIAPHFSLHSNAGGVCPPAFDGRGGVVMPWLWHTGAWGLLDIDSQRVTEFILPPTGSAVDQTANVSMGGRRLFILYGGMSFGSTYMGVYDFAAREFAAIPRPRPGAPGVTGKLSVMTDSLESANNAAAIAGGFFYHIAHHRLTAWTSDGEKED